MEKNGNSDRIYFLGLQNDCRLWLQPWNLKMFALWKKSYDKARQHIKKQRHHFADEGPSSQSYGFSRSHVHMWDLDHTESWAPKNWCFWTVVLKKTLEIPLDSKEIKWVNPKGNQPWIFIGNNGAEAEAPILWPPDVKNQLTGKYPDAGKDWGQEEKWVMTEDEMDGNINSMNRSLSKLQEIVKGTGKPGVLQSMGSQRVGHNWTTE